MYVALCVVCPLDGLLGFADTYGEQAVELQIKTFEAKEKKQQLQTELKEVSCCGMPGGWGEVPLYLVSVCR